MDELTEWYKDNLPARVDALEMARSLYDQNADKGMQSIKRIAHALKGSGSTYGFPQISAAAKELENSDSDNLSFYFDCLLDVLKNIINNSDNESFLLEQNKIGILIIDDDMDICTILKMKLSSSKRLIYTAHSKKEALEIVATKKISFMILDIMLPDADGREILLEFRENPISAAIPIFIISSLTGLQPKTECYALGADEFFEKPIDPDYFAASVAAKLHREAKMSQSLHCDQFTGLLNKIAITEAYDRALAYAKRMKESLSLAMIDIDFFKKINDVHGHSTGDKILKEFSSILLETLRKSDVVGRWGGEEFVVILPNTDEQGAKSALNKVLDVIKERHFFAMNSSATINLSFSAGVVLVDEEDSFQANLDRADKLLYIAKMAGRKMVCSSVDEHKSLKLKVLLAEDDNFIARVVTKQLEDDNFQVIHCKDGLTAYKDIFDNIHENVYNLVLLDVNMPGMDGFKLLQHIRQSDQYKKVPVVMLTAMDRKKDIVFGVTHGATDYVLKPFNPKRLLDRIRILLRIYESTGN